MKEKRQRRERPRRKLRRGPSVGFLPYYAQKKTGKGRRGPEPARGAQRRPDDKERLRGSHGEGAPEQAETEEGEAQKEAPERSRSLISSLLRVTGDIPLLSSLLRVRTRQVSSESRTGSMLANLAAATNQHDAKP